MTAPYTHYAVLNGKDPDYNKAQVRLATAVELHMLKGWTPQGGVVFVGSVNELGTVYFVFCQAVILNVGSGAQGAPR